MIHYRFQGLADELRKAHTIVLAKRSKVGVRSAKEHGLGWIEKMH